MLDVLILYCLSGTYRRWLSLVQLRSCTVDKRHILYIGSIHYPRATPSMWPRLMRLSRDAGLNTIDTYVFWSIHDVFLSTCCEL